jgi:hypothetical protein
MPLVFAQNEVNLSDISYADVLGEAYEFPAQYHSLIRPGEQFVYYRGRRRADGRSQIPVYFGCGIVHHVFPVGHDRYQCSITDFCPFEPTVPFKDGDRYREPAANGRPPKAIGFYFEPGVRPLDQESFDAICEAGLSAASPPVQPGYADPVLARRVDALAMRLAITEATKRWPKKEIRRMPHNNPGFDIEVRRPRGVTRYIKVEGTTAADPRFFVSAGEVAYSRAHPEEYSTWIFHSIELEVGTATLVEHAGAITADHFDLQPTQYFGRLRASSVGSD